MLGVLIGTLVSFVLCTFWTKPFYIYRDVFCVKFIKYITWEGEKIITSLVIAVVTYYSQFWIETGNNALLSFVLKMIVTVILSNGLLVLRYLRTKEFQYMKNMMFNILTKLKYKKKKV